MLVSFTKKGVQTEEAFGILQNQLTSFTYYNTWYWNRRWAHSSTTIENYERIFDLWRLRCWWDDIWHLVRKPWSSWGWVSGSLPNRFTDGYGPNSSVYKYFIENQGISKPLLRRSMGEASLQLSSWPVSRCKWRVSPLHAPEELPNAYTIAIGT